MIEEHTQEPKLSELMESAQIKLRDYFRAQMPKEFPVLLELDRCRVGEVSDDKFGLHFTCRAAIEPAEKQWQTDIKFAAVEKAVRKVIKSHPALCDKKYSMGTLVTDKKLSQINVLFDDSFDRAEYRELMANLINPQPKEKSDTPLKDWLRDTAANLGVHSNAARC